MPIHRLRVLQIAALMKQFEIRRSTPKYRKVKVGDRLSLFSGQWCVWCEVLSVAIVQGTTELVKSYRWRSLMPELCSESECISAYHDLGCTTGGDLLVWGVKPTHCKYYGYFSNRKVQWTNNVKEIALDILEQLYND